MSKNFLVLCFGHDQKLLETRAAVLVTEYRVVSISTLEELKQLLGSIDLILLCHTLPEEDYISARKLIHQRLPAAKVLSMTKVDGDRCVQDGEIAVRGLDGPAVLLQKIDTLLHPVLQAC